MRYSKFTLVILMAALLCVSGSAMADKVATGPGYIDLSFIEIPDDADEIQDIDLSLVLKDVVREAKANDDMEIAELLTPEVQERIENILDNRPESEKNWRGN